MFITDLTWEYRNRVKALSRSTWRTACLTVLNLSKLTVKSCVHLVTYRDLLHLAISCVFTFWNTSCDWCFNLWFWVLVEKTFQVFMTNHTTTIDATQQYNNTPPFASRILASVGSFVFTYFIRKIMMDLVLSFRNKKRNQVSGHEKHKP